MRELDIASTVLKEKVIQTINVTKVDKNVKNFNLSFTSAFVVCKLIAQKRK